MWIWKSCGTMHGLLAEYDILERSRCCFPETPGPVILLFMFTVDQQDFFTFSQPAFL